MKRYITLSLCAILATTSMIQAVEMSKPKETENIKKDDMLLAIINGHKIWKSDFDKNFEQSNSENKNKKINDIINATILVQYASTQTLFNDKKLNLEVKEYEKTLKSKGKKFTNKDYRMVVGLTVIDRLAEEYAKNGISDEAVDSYYKKRKKNFSSLPFVDSIILTFSSKEEAERVLTLIKKVKKTEQKETFLKLAKKYGQNRKGTYIKREYKFGLATTPFNLKLFSLKKGSYSDTIIPLSDGRYKIIYCVNKGVVSKAPSRDELDKNIRFVIKYKKKLTWVSDKLSELKKEAKIEVKKKF